MFSPRSSRSYEFKSTLSAFSFVLQVFLSELCFQKVAREGIKARKGVAFYNLDPVFMLVLSLWVDAPENQGHSQQDLGCLLFLLRLIRLNNTKAAYTSSRVWLPWYKAHCRKNVLIMCVHDKSWNTSENVRNSVKYLYLIAGHAIDAVRTWYKRTTTC